MNNTLYTLGCGDRFGRQGKAQLSAFIEAGKRGINACPVWNKSHREHTTVHTEPGSVRAEADAATTALGWEQPYFVDADHISLATADGFIESSDFFTLDVADKIGEKTSDKDLAEFVDSMGDLLAGIELPGLKERLDVNAKDLTRVAERYLGAVQEAGRIYRHISARKTSPFIVEVSMDETDEPQTPIAMLLILAMIAQEKIPADTIAPKFSGRFNKGVDYVGDLALFEREFEQDLLVLTYAAQQFGLKESIRLSVHSGSDKFSIYPVMNRMIKKHNAGLHVKTAGTTWLEEVIGLAASGGEGLAVAKQIYFQALERYDELAAPYATVIDIDPQQLPTPGTVEVWSSSDFVSALEHNPECPDYNPSFRQLIHVAYKVAYELGDRYFQALENYAGIVGEKVTHNLLERHLAPIFGDGQ